MAGHERSRALSLTRGRIVLLAVVAVVVTVVVLARGPTGDGTTGDGTTGKGGPPAAASPLLNVELSTFDGDPVRLARFAGRPLVVNFFASWCGPCAREMPAFAAVHERRGDEVGFVGVNLQDSPEGALDLVQRTGVTYEILRDTDGALFRTAGGFAMPTTLFLDADGSLVDAHSGELSEAGLEDRIDRLAG